MNIGLRAALISILSTAAGHLVAFENTKVMPKNVRSVDIRTVDTHIENKTDAGGQPQPLAKPLDQDLTFAKMVKSESALKSSQLNAFLTSNGFSDTDVVGTFSADLKAHVRVTAPIISYGLTERLTLAAAIPVYQAQTAINVGFVPTPRAQQFLTALAQPENNQTASAREVGDKLNHAVERLNQKLLDNGFRNLRNWDGQGLGDITLAGKFRGIDTEGFALAATGGVVLPTGRTDDVDVINDLAFGDGQTDVFTQIATDEFIGNGFTINEFAKYTEQLAGRKQVRLVTEDEKIEVGKSEADFKLGSKWEAGASLQWEPSFGLVTGIGYNHLQKLGDNYRGIPPESQRALEANTDQQANNSLFQLGYSTVPLFRAKRFPVPLETKFTYVHQLSSKNLPESDLAQFDFSLFF